MFTLGRQSDSRAFAMNSYVSSDLTHFVGRRCEPEEQYQLLVKILRDGWLTHPPHQPGNTGGGLSVARRAHVSDGRMYKTEVICFCDIRAASQRIHMNKYSEFGISFPKGVLVAKGASPIYYIASTSVVSDTTGKLVTRAKYFDERVALCQRLMDELILKNSQ